MIRRVLNRLKLEFSKLIRRIMPNRNVTLILDCPLRICLPFFSREQLASYQRDLGELNALKRFGKVELIFITIGDPDAPVGVDGTLISLLDYRSLFSVLTSTSAHLIIPDYVRHETESLREWCEAYHVSFYNSVAQTVLALQERGPITLSGPARATHAVFQAFASATKGGGQYGFCEVLNWDVIKKLPYKFEELRMTAEVNAYPMDILQGPLGRLERQRSVGRLYREYLQGETVLDVGCDIRGVEEFVGPNTRYTGADMHGKPDVLVDLDKDPFPFAVRSFDTVVCIENLEHLKNMHKVFDDILSASRKTVICSLPNEFSHSKNRFMDALGLPSSSAVTSRGIILRAR